MQKIVEIGPGGHREYRERREAAPAPDLPYDADVEGAAVRHAALADEAQARGDAQGELRHACSALAYAAQDALCGRNPAGAQRVLGRLREQVQALRSYASAQAAPLSADEDAARHYAGLLKALEQGAAQGTPMRAVRHFEGGTQPRTYASVTSQDTHVRTAEALDGLPGGAALSLCRSHRASARAYAALEGGDVDAARQHALEARRETYVGIGATTLTPELHAAHALAVYGAQALLDRTQAASALDLLTPADDARVYGAQAQATRTLAVRSPALAPLASAQGRMAHAARLADEHRSAEWPEIREHLGQARAYTGRVDPTRLSPDLRAQFEALKGALTQYEGAYDPA